MTRFLPILLALAYAGIMLALSVWRTQKVLNERSTPLTERRLLSDLAPLARALDLPRIDLRVYEMPEINALAAPDGRIYLTRGLVRAWAAGQISGPEIASVVAHELGHLSMGHLRRRMIDFTGQNAVFVVLTAVLSRWLPFIGVWIANLISTAVMARLSRRDEFEADEFAAALMVKAGLGTAPQRRLLAKLGDLSAQAIAGPDWLRSHPPIPERIAAIEAAEARWGG